MKEIKDYHNMCKELRFLSAKIKTIKTNNPDIIHTGIYLYMLGLEKLITKNRVKLRKKLFIIKNKK